MLSDIGRFVQIIRESGVRNAFGKTKSHLGRKVQLWICCDIGPDLPRSTMITHPVGIAITRKAQIGENVRIYQNVTIGVKVTGSDKAPTIGDNVRIYAGAIITGDVDIRDGAVIGANSVVLDDVPKNTTVAGIPATEIETPSGELDRSSPN